MVGSLMRASSSELVEVVPRLYHHLVSVLVKRNKSIELSANAGILALYSPNPLELGNKSDNVENVQSSLICKVPDLRKSIQELTGP